MGFDPLEYLEECNRWQIRLDLEQRCGEQPLFVADAWRHTKQAPLTKLGWSVTYIGAVSYRKLVSMIAISASF